MKSRIVFFLALISSSFVFAQRMTREEYIEKYKDLAIVQMKEHKIPASITLAQGLLESDNGNSLLATKAKNHFGIKCHSSWTGKKIYKDEDCKQVNDEIFSTMDEIRKHEKSLLNILNQLSRVYKELFNNSNNPHTTFSGIPEQFSGDNNLDNNLDKFLDF